MTLRKKAIIFFLVFFLGWFTLVSIILMHEIIWSYTKIEKQKFDYDIERVEKGLEGMLDRHSALMLDWTNWDEAYAFVEYPNEMFINDIIESNHYVDQKMNYLMMFDQNNQVVHASGYDLIKNYVKEVPKSLSEEVIKYRNEKGVLLIDGNPIAFVSREVSNNEGTAPKKGLFVFAYDVTDSAIKEVGENLKETVIIHDINALNQLNERTRMEKVSSDKSYAYIEYPYENTSSYLRFRVSLRHDVLNLGKATLRHTMTIFALSFVLLMIVVLFVAGSAVERIRRLVEELSQINRNGHLTERVKVEKDDEIGMLRQAINLLLDELQDVHTQVVHHASYDELTGVYNRRVGLERLQVEIEKTAVTGSPLTIVFVDVNGLKKVNDKLGHHVGDDYLIHTCHGIKMVMDLEDVITRMGGDEFLVVFPSKTLEEVRVLFEPVHEILYKIHRQYSLPYRMSVSAGIFQYEEGMPIDTFIERADELMYQEKQLHNKSVNEVIVIEEGV